MCIYTGSAENHKLLFTQNLSLIMLLHLLVYFYLNVFNQYICGQKYICFWPKLRLFSHSHAVLIIFLKIIHHTKLKLLYMFLMMPWCSFCCQFIFVHKYVPFASMFYEVCISFPFFINLKGMKGCIKFILQLKSESRVKQLNFCIASFLLMC